MYFFQIVFLLLCTIFSCNSMSENIVSQILKQMNHRGDACQDFYDFACGTFDSIEEDNYENVLFDMYKKQNNSKPLKVFQQFYDNCMDYGLDALNYENRMESVKNIINNCKNTTDLTNLFGQLILRQALPFLDVGMGPDENSKFMFQLKLPEYILNNWWGISALNNRCLQKMKYIYLTSMNINLDDIYNTYKNCSKNYQDYFEMVNATMGELYPKMSINKSDFDYIIEIFDVLPDPIEVMTIYDYNSYTLKNVTYLQETYSLINWQDLFSFLLGSKVDESMLVQVYFEQYFSKIFKILIKIDTTSLRNILLAIHAHDLFIATVIEPDRTTGSKYCIDLAKVLLPKTWNFLNQDNVEGYQTEHVKEMFNEFRNKLKTALSDSTWAEDSTLNTLLDKCDNLELYIQNNKTNNSNNLENTNFKNYQYNLVKLLENVRKEIYLLYNDSVSSENIFAYFFDPLRNKPRIFLNNEIVASHDLLCRITTDQPEVLNFAKVGFHLAQQIAAKFNSLEIQKILSSSGEYNEFVRLMRNIMDGSKKLYQITFNFNGTLSTNSRIVENTAFRLLTDSVKYGANTSLPFINSSDWSDKKLFYIATGQEFCKKSSVQEFVLKMYEDTTLPVSLSVQNMFGNSEDFSKVFDCAKGAQMNPEIDKFQFPYIKFEQNYLDGESLGNYEAQVNSSK